VQIVLLFFEIAFEREKIKNLFFSQQQLPVKSVALSKRNPPNAKNQKDKH